MTLSDFSLLKNFGQEDAWPLLNYFLSAPSCTVFEDLISAAQLTHSTCVIGECISLPQSPMMIQSHGSQFPISHLTEILCGRVPLGLEAQVKAESKISH